MSPVSRSRGRLCDKAPVTAAGRALIARALSLFEEMDATGWIEEARRAQTETEIAKE